MDPWDQNHYVQLAGVHFARAGHLRRSARSSLVRHFHLVIVPHPYIHSLACKRKLEGGKLRNARLFTPFVYRGGDRTQPSAFP